MGNMLKFFKLFLKDRYIQIRYLNTLSSPYHTPTGVPQGSVASPTLFNIMINDLFFQSDNTLKYSKFADDLALWTSDKSTTDCFQNMQTKLSTLEKWTKKWGIKISPSKTKAIFFSRRKNPTFSLKINNITIELVKHHKFLGIIFDKNLTWRPHLEDLKIKCNSDLNLLKLLSNQSWGADYSVLHLLYKSLILSKINYGCFLYDTSTKSNLEILNRIQFKAARIMLGALPCTRTEHLEKLANLTPLHHLRKSNLLKFATQILSNPVNPLRDLILQQNNETLESQFVLKPRPISIRIKNILKTINIDPLEIATIEPYLKQDTFKTFAYDDIHHLQKNQLSDVSWQKLHANILDKHKNHCVIYTDGSVQGNKSGCGAWSKNFSLKARLPDNTSILTCELYAIYI